MHIEKRYNLYNLESSPSITRMIKARWGREREYTRCRERSAYKIDLKGTEWGGVDWISLAQYKDQWRNLVKTLGFHTMLGIQCVAE